MISDEQMSTLGTWMQESEARLERYLDKQIDEKLGTWLHEVEDRLGRKIDAR